MTSLSRYMIGSPIYSEVGVSVVWCIVVLLHKHVNFRYFLTIISSTCITYAVLNTQSGNTKHAKYWCFCIVMQQLHTFSHRHIIYLVSPVKKHLRTTWSIHRPGEILVVGEPEVELIIYLLRIVLFRFYNRGEVVAGSSADYIDTDLVKEPVR